MLIATIVLCEDTQNYQNTKGTQREWKTVDMDIIIMITDKHKTFIHKKRMYEMSFKKLNALVSKVRCVRCGESN